MAAPVRVGVGDTGVHEGLVLLLVAGVFVEEAAAGELGNLLAHQTLFVVAVTQALLGEGRVHPQVLQHVVAGEPAAVAGEERIGLDEVVRLRIPVR